MIIIIIIIIITIKEFTYVYWHWVGGGRFEAYLEIHKIYCLTIKIYTEWTPPLTDY
jgi:hypothetical protein